MSEGPMSKLEQIESLLKVYDWDYEESGDYLGDSRGWAIRAAINVLWTELSDRDLPVARILWRAYAPEHLKESPPARELPEMETVKIINRMFNENFMRIS